MGDSSNTSTLGRGSAIRLGEILFWPGKHLLLKKGVFLKLRHKESETLLLLCQHYPNAVSRQVFEQAVWPEGYVIAHTITQTVKGLRDALGDLSREIVVTLPKQGYALNQSPTVCSDQIALPAEQSVEPELTGEGTPYYTVALPWKCCSHWAGIFLGFLLIFCGLFQFGGYLTKVYLEPSMDVLHPIKIGFDGKLDAPFLREHADSPYYMLKKIDGQYIACFHYKQGVKCESEK